MHKNVALQYYTTTTVCIGSVSLAMAYSIECQEKTKRMGEHLHMATIDMDFQKCPEELSTTPRCA